MKLTAHLIRVKYKQKLLPISLNHLTKCILTLKDTAKIVTTDQEKLIKKAKFVRKSNIKTTRSEPTKSDTDLKEALSNLTIKDEADKKLPESCAKQSSKSNIENNGFKFNFII